MSVAYRHLLHQGKTLAALGDVVTIDLRRQLGLAKATTSPPLPGPEYVETIAPRSPELVRDFLRHIGGTPSAYRGSLPPHLFPQWVFSVAEKTLRQAPYPLFKMVNGGARMEVNGRLPADQPLRVAARLEAIDDDGRRVVLHQRTTTGTEAEPELVVAHIFEVILLGGGDRRAEPEKKKRPRSLVPPGAHELALLKIPADAGLAFAALTGDFNPVHWLRPYARALGFRGTILHGFATMARAIEGLNASLFSGDVSELVSFEARFTRPLLLPARVGLYVDRAERTVFVGDAPGGPAYLTGTFDTRQRRAGAAEERS